MFEACWCTLCPWYDSSFQINSLCLKITPNLSYLVSKIIYRHLTKRSGFILCITLIYCYVLVVMHSYLNFYHNFKLCLLTYSCATKWTLLSTRSRHNGGLCGSWKIRCISCFLWRFMFAYIYVYKGLWLQSNIIICDLELVLLQRICIVTFYQRESCLL